MKFPCLRTCLFLINDHIHDRAGIQTIDLGAAVRRSVDSGARWIMCINIIKISRCSRTKSAGVARWSTPILALQVSFT